ncbi:unnamed protein product, partial [Meganyctiphanes norvegica]
RDALRQMLLERYFGLEYVKRINDQKSKSLPDSILVRSGKTLLEVQCHLASMGAADLVVELVMKSQNCNNIFGEAIELGIALLEGGNTSIQLMLYKKFMTVDNKKHSEKMRNFFQVFYQKMQDAQQEIRATVTVNTSDINSKSNDEKDATKGDDNKLARRNKVAKKPNGLVVTDEIREELGAAVLATSQAYSNIRAGNAGEDTGNALGLSSIEEIDGSRKEKEDETPKLSPKIAVMEPILRFLQLLCENHNSKLQNFLRSNNKNKFNLVSETLLFLDCICGSTTGGLGLLGLYINEMNVELIIQTLETLTEYCQGPCHENQNCIATHESNGLHIITALVVNDINPLAKSRMDLVLKLKNNASKLLLAIMESRADSENADRILQNMNIAQLLDVVYKAFHQETMDDEEFYEEGGADAEEVVSPKEVGHNIYILCHQLAKHDKDLNSLLHDNDKNVNNEKLSNALKYYSDNTAQIEITRSDRTLEQIVFPIPTICQYLTSETKLKVLNTAELDEQGSKVTDFFTRCEDMFNEMKWQEKLRTQAMLSSISNYMSLWARLLFLLALICNIIVALFYPYEKTIPSLSGHISGLLWVVLLISLAIIITVPKPILIYFMGFTLILRLIFTFGPELTLTLLGSVNVVIKGIHLVSLMGNKGTFGKSVEQMITDSELLYHVMYLVVCVLGLSVHPFCYCILLFDVVYREETLLNVMRSVTRNGWSIILTAALALILVYMFSIIGYMFFRDDFIVDVNDEHL